MPYDGPAGSPHIRNLPADRLFPQSPSGCTARIAGFRGPARGARHDSSASRFLPCRNEVAASNSSLDSSQLFVALYRANLWGG